MNVRRGLPAAAAALLGAAATAQEGSIVPEARLMTVDPGHFHAALVQKEMYAGVAPRVHVYAPPGPDLDLHLARIDAFNSRPDAPTRWTLDVHAAPDFFERMLAAPPGNVAIFSGRNRAKIGRIARSVEAGLHVLADKPWILEPEDLPRLDAALAAADRTGVVAYDIMTERFEITSILQRAFVNDAAVFGEIVRGTEAEPAVYMESVHYLMKTVAGAPLVRPWWFFGTADQGEGLNDVGTHLVDLVQWTLFPDQALDYRADAKVLGAQRWPTMIPEADFRRVTGQPGFPPALAAMVRNGALECFFNTLVSYTLRGVHTKLNVIWDWEAEPGGGDTHYAIYRGTRSRVEVRQTRGQRFRPELYVVPNEGQALAGIEAAASARVAALQREFPGVSIETRGPELHIGIPDAYRVGHEAHFAEVARQFLRYLQHRGSVPGWERPNMLAKYYVTTTGTALSRQAAPRVAPRIAPK